MTYEDELGKILVRVRRDLANARIKYRGLRTTIGGDDRMQTWRRLQGLVKLENSLTEAAEHARRARI